MAAITNPSALIAFAAGILTIATPCIIPILPPLLAGSVGHRLKPVFIVLGASTTFTLMGGALAALGIAAGATKELLRLIAVVIMITMGAVMADKDINAIYTKYSSAVVNSLYALKDRVSGLKKIDAVNPEVHPLAGGFLLGLSLGVIWIPCVGPILGSILALSITQADIAKSSLFLFSYSMGIAVPILAVAYGGKYASSKMGWVVRNYEVIQRLAGWIVILTGVAILFGLDRWVQTAVLPYFPFLEEKLLALAG